MIEDYLNSWGAIYRYTNPVGKFVDVHEVVLEHELVNLEGLEVTWRQIEKDLVPLKTSVIPVYYKAHVYSQYN